MTFKNVFGNSWRFFSPWGMHLLSLHAACRSWTSSIQLVQSRSNSFSSAMCHQMDPKDFAGIWDTYCVRKTNHFNFTNALTARVVGALQVTSQPASSILLCSPLPSGTRRTPGPSIPWFYLPTSFSVCLVFFPPSPCFARWFWPDLMNRSHVHTTSICVSLPLVRNSSYDPIACWILARTSSLVTWSLYEMRSVLR